MLNCLEVIGDLHLTEMLSVKNRTDKLISDISELLSQDVKTLDFMFDEVC